MLGDCGSYSWTRVTGRKVTQRHGRVLAWWAGAMMVTPGAVQPLTAQVQEPLTLPRIQGVVKLDGLSNEPAWRGVDSLPLSVQVPSFGEPARERSVFLVAYDDDFLYVAGRLYDTEPEKIQAASLRRDDGNPQNDYFGIFLDTFNDNENAVGFWTNPAGLRADAAILNDAAIQPVLNASWNAFWDVAVARDDKGWYAEFRIPFSSLRFQEIDGEVVMGMSLFRQQARLWEITTFPSIPPLWGYHSFLKPSQMREVVLEQIRNTQPLYVTPYTLGGFGRSHRLEGNRWLPDDQTVGEVGLDVKLGVSRNLTLDLTANTDFAQVEADNQQVNLTRFSLFFPEKRPFFQERGSIFEFRTGPVDRLFHSRRIGIVGGEAARILGGARLVGRIGDWDVGVMNMQTADHEALDGENFGVVRLRRRVLNENSYVGGMLTTRISNAGRHNVVYAGDALLRLRGDDYLTVNLGQTLDDGPSIRQETLGATLARLRWERRNQQGFGYALDVTRAGPNFDPGLGFQARSDYLRIGDRLFVGWIPGPHSPLLSHSIALEGFAFLRNDDGSVESAEIGPAATFSFKSGSRLNMRARARIENLDQSFRLSEDTEVPAGDYAFHDLTVSVSTPRQSLMTASLALSGGSFFDGSLVSATLSPRWAPSRHISLSGAYEYNRVRFDTRAQGFDSHLVRARVDMALSTQVLTSAFVQHSSVANRIEANFRLRYNPGEGHDLYVVYNQGLNTERFRVDPALPRTGSRTLLLKYSRTLTVGR